jgi:hypothetical protein
MNNTTALWDLPVWAVLVLAVIAGLTIFNTVDSITKIWRKPEPKPTVAHGSESIRGVRPQ